MKKEATTLDQPFIPANVKVWLVFSIKKRSRKRAGK